MSQIVVGVDGSEHARRALEWAVAEARFRNAHVTAVWAYTVPVFFLGPEAMTAPVVNEDDIRASVMDALEAFVAPIQSSHPNVAIDRVAAKGPAARALREQAADADLLVIGSRGLGGFKGLLLGSVSTQCLHHPPCPVVVIPPASPVNDAAVELAGE